MTVTAENAGPPTARAIARQVWADLQPYEGRWAATWRIAAICALVAMVFMTYRIPEAAIACYLVFFVFKPESTESSLMAVGLLILVSLVVLLMFGIAQVTLESPPLQLVAIILASTLFMFLGVASQLGPVGGIISLVIAFIITLFGDVPLGELLTRGMLYAWLMASTPMAVILLFNATAGLSPVARMQRDLAHRLDACADAFEQPIEAETRKRLRELLGEGNGELEKRMGLLQLFHARSREVLARLSLCVSASYQAMLATGAWLDSGACHVDATTTDLANRLRRHAATLRAGGLPEAPPAPSDTLPPTESLAATTAAEPALNAALPTPAAAAPAAPFPPAGIDDAMALLHRSLGRLEGDASHHPNDAAPKKPFMAPDAWTNPEYVRYALKTTMAAVICYVIYTGIDWQDIHTAMITCYIVALGTTGETVHKLTLRIIGCLIGAALGIGSVHFLITPHMTGVGELMVLVFAGCLVAAWVANGPERIAYAGVQIGLAFLMTVLQGFGPDPKIDVALDRVAGIILGNVVTFIIFTQIWPASVRESCQQRLASIGDKLRRLATLPPWAERDRLGTAADIQQTAALTRDTLPLAIFDPASIQPSPEEWRDMRADLDDANRLSATLTAHGMAGSATASDASALSHALNERMTRWQPPAPTDDAHGPS